MQRKKLIEKIMLYGGSAHFWESVEALRELVYSLPCLQGLNLEQEQVTATKLKVLLESVFRWTNIAISFLTVHLTRMWLRLFDNRAWREEKGPTALQIYAVTQRGRSVKTCCIYISRRYRNSYYFARNIRNPSRSENANQFEINLPWKAFTFPETRRMSFPN